jgi:glycosyltransferase involved in cell wall biosynthesis
MRIAHFVQRYPPALGGSEAYFARLSRHLVANGQKVTVFTTNANDLEAFWTTRGRCVRAGTITEHGVEVRRYPLWRMPGHRRMLKALSFLPVRPWQRLTLSCNPIAWGMARDAICGAERFDVVHASAFPYGWILECARRLARRLAVPFVVTPFLHLGDQADPRDRTRRAYLSPALLQLLRQADRVIVQTTVERDALLDCGFAAESLVLQGMGVDRSSCTGGSRARARSHWNIGESEVVVGHLANNSREKGTVDLLRAAERAWRVGERFRLVLAGPEMPNFRSFWNTFRSRDKVLRFGSLTEEEKRDFFAGIDIFAMPSRSDSFGLVFLEAWANGVPNVAYRAGGVAGVIRHGKDGLLAQCGDISGLADALCRLVEDRELRTRMGAEGCDRLFREFSWDEKLDQVERLYRELTTRKQLDLSFRARSVFSSEAASAKR